MEYRTEQELKYYGSDYNKFLNKECSKEMTVINIDVAQYKRSKGILRLCESKHEGEKTKFCQKELLNLLAAIFKVLNKMYQNQKFQIFIVIANPPYDRAHIFNLITGKERWLNKQEFISFSNMEYDPTI